MHLYKLEDFLLYELSCAGISWKTAIALAESHAERPRSGVRGLGSEDRAGAMKSDSNCA